MDKIKIREALVVEGRYDKNTLSQLVDAPIFVTDGFGIFDEAFAKGKFDRVITTNLTWQDPSIQEREWFIEADMSRFIAMVIDFLNHNDSITGVLTPTDKIHEFVKKYNAGADAKDVIPDR